MIIVDMRPNVKCFYLTYVDSLIGRAAIRDWVHKVLIYSVLHL